MPNRTIIYRGGQIRISVSSPKDRYHIYSNNYPFSNDHSLRIGDSEYILSADFLRKLALKRVGDLE